MKRNTNNSNELAERNRKIYNERENGDLVVAIAQRHGISVPRVHRIHMQEENKVLKEENLDLKDKLYSCELRRKGD